MRDVVARLPTWAVLLALLAFGVAVTAVVVVGYDRGVLPISGPFVLLGWLPLLGWLRVSAIRARTLRRRRHLVARLGTVSRLVTAERNLPGVQRASGATDRSLAEAAHLTEQAAALLGLNREDSVTVVGQLGGVCDRWAPDAPLTRAVHDAVGAARKLTLAWGEVREERARA